jgi:hypothetical protein
MGGFGALVGLGNSRAVAVAIFAVGMTTAVLRFLKWLITFVTERLDVGRVELVKRLRHVEQELGATREVMMLLLGELAKTDASNPALRHAAQLLRSVPPISTMDNDELVNRLHDIPGTKRGRDDAVAA